MAFIKNNIINVYRSFSPGPILRVYGEIQAANGGYVHYITDRGVTWTWGANNGQLGDNGSGARATPVNLGGSTKTFCKIDGYNHTLAIDKNGMAWGWGSNFFGQLGDNTGTTRSTPVSVVGTTKTFCQITVGGSHTLAIDKNGRAWGWGRGVGGPLGDGGGGSYTPISVIGAVKTFCKISTHQGHTLAIDKNGRAWAWGNNGSGRLGNNATVSQVTPVSVVGATKTFCEIKAGSDFSLALDKNGRAWAWGTNVAGQLGDNTVTSRLTPVSVNGLVKTFCRIATGVQFSVAIDKNGQVWGWGVNGNGQLGDGTLISRLTPVSIAGATKTFCRIETGYDFTVAITHDGYVWAWGAPGSGQLGNNQSERPSLPISIAGVKKTFCHITAGISQGAGVSTHGFAIDNYGRGWAWGSNGSGELGDNTTTSRPTPVQIAGATKTFCQVAQTGGASHMLAIDKNGQVWAWGRGSFGGLGDNTGVNRCTPVMVAGTTKTFCKVAAGIGAVSTGGLSAGIDKNGRVWTWGEGTRGALGDNTLINKLTPVSIAGTTKTFCHIVVGTGMMIALTQNGRAWAWGTNINGQLGDNTVTSRLTPVSVQGTAKTFCKIAAANNSVLAIDKNGRVWGWGDNTSGELGDNTTTARLTPVSVLGTAKTFCHIAIGDIVGNSTALAIDKNGKLWSWGSDSNGALGTGTNNQNKSTPVAVCAGNRTFCKVAAQRGALFAIDKNGLVWAWGFGTSFGLGNNAINITTPVRICNL